MTVRWGMQSTAGIGRGVAAAVRGCPEAELVAVAGRDPDRAARYAAELGVPHLLDLGCYCISAHRRKDRHPGSVAVPEHRFPAWITTVWPPENLRVLLRRTLTTAGAAS